MGCPDRTIGAEPVQPFVSVAVTVKVELPDAVGVPASTPADESATPAGGAPAVTLQVTGATPPSCVNVTGPYAALAVPCTAFVMLLTLGLVPVAAACGIGAYEAARTFTSAPTAAVVGLVAAVPPLLPLLGGGSIELTWTALYVVLLAAAHLLVTRSRPSAAFAVAAVVAAIGSAALASLA